MPDEVILRRWTGKVLTERAREYVRYVAGTGIDEIGATAGNLGNQITIRDLGDGTTEICALSWWTGMDAIRTYAGDEPERAHYYPEDDEY